MGDKERELRKFESEAYLEVQTIHCKADAEATGIYSASYNQSAEAVDLYEFVKTLDTYQSVIDSSTTLVLSTDSDLLGLVKGFEATRK